MYQLEAPSFFYFLAIIPVVIGLYIAFLFWKKNTQKKFATSQAINKLAPTKSNTKAWLKVVLLCLIIAFLVGALVNPRVGTQTEEVTREGVDIVFAIDVSRSMLVEDIAPNRLERAKQIVSQTLNRLSGDRVGIVGYAGSAFPQVPITTDYNAVRMFLRSMHTDMVSSQGTAIAEALKLSQTFFDNTFDTSKVIILLSDGEDHQGQVEVYAKELANNNITVISVVLGTPRGVPIPIRRNGVLQEYLRDRNGERVISQMEEEVLREIATLTQGVFVSSDTSSQTVNEIIDFIDTLDKEAFESVQFAAFKYQYQWFLGLALLLLFVDLLVLERKTSWFSKLNLFNEKK